MRRESVAPISGLARQGAAVTRLTLELAPGSDPVTGTITAGEGSARQFQGYVGLIAAVEGLVSAKRPDEAPVRRSDAPSET